jgi:hypothetical protein
LCKGCWKCFIRKRGYKIILKSFVAPEEEEGVVLLVVQEVFSDEVLVSNESVPGFADAIASQERDDGKA